MGIKNLYVDLSVFGPWQTGVALYSLEMAKFLANTFRCRIIVPQYHAHHFGESAILCPPPISFPGTGSWRHSGEVLKSIKSSESLLYCPHAFGTVLPINQILTIHDLIPYKYPTRHFFNRFYFQFMLPKFIKRDYVSLICTVSRTSKEEICTKFNLAKNKVEVVPNGIDVNRWKSQSSYAEGEKYLLVVSANRIYKNTIEILENHDLWAKKYHLKIVSSKSRYGKQIRKAVLEMGLSGRVQFLESISDEELRALFQGAEASIYPSLIEGFGRPPLESMAAGRPVIISDIPVHKEMFGSAGIFISPGKRESWESAFKNLNDTEYVDAKISAGLQVAERYSLANGQAALKNVLLNSMPELGELLK